MTEEPANRGSLQGLLGCAFVYGLLTLLMAAVFVVAYALAG